MLRIHVSVCLKALIVRCVALLVAVAGRAAAQADVIRGRISGEQNEAVAGASVTATSTSGNVSRNATTDRDGRFTITFVNGDGDYWVSIAALGFNPRRMQVRRSADQEILIADARLTRAGVALDPVKVNAPGTRRRAERDTTFADIGGTERRLNTEALTAEQLADLALLAGTLPGVQVIPNADGGPSGWSVLGLGPEQNETTLNGMRFGGTALPRDAGFDASVVTSPYDVSRGGFSGSQLALRTKAPSNLTLRANSVAFDAPWLQWTDPIGRSLGQDFGALSLGGVLTKPIKLDRSFVHVAYQLGRRYSDLSTLLSADDAALRASGVAGDSVRRLTSILGRAGVPTTLSRVPSQRLSDQGLVYGSIDLTSPSASGQALNVTFTGNWNRQRAALISSLAPPAHGGERNTWGGSAQARHTRYFSGGILSETQLALGASRSDGSPYLTLPNASVRINSAYVDGSTSVATLFVGGATGLDRVSQSLALSAMNQLSWFSLNNKHRLKLTTEITREAVDERLAVNTLGTFQFNSLADFEAGSAVAFRRQLTSPTHDFAHYITAISLGDAYSPTAQLQFNYGLRVDANHFGSTPQTNALVGQELGISNDHTPNRVRLSPRLGFSYTGGPARQTAVTDGGARAPRTTVRGGIGVFQGVPATSTLGPMLDNTGLGNGAQRLECLGTATPRANWAAYAADIASVPSVCADGTGGSVFVNARPGVTLFAPDYSAPRSVRSNVQWSGQVLGGRFSARADATYSLNLEQTGSVDLNFTPTARFTLRDEAGRPMFAAPSSIAPASGVVSSNDARRSERFARVTELRSDLRSDSREVTLSVAPAGFRSLLDWNLSYVYSNYREQTYGFSSTTGNPFDKEWSRSWLDSHHQFVYTLGVNVFDALRLSWAGTVRSGLPYTPMIAGDMNGDGFENDRAFVFDPAATADPAVASAMRTLLRDGPSCLARQLGRLAARSSCQGPWTTSASLTIGLNPVRWWRSNRLDVLFQVSNPLGAADLVMNGADRLRGWGQPANPDAALYYVRGFDPATQRFKYEVNPRFGSTAPATTAIRAPVVFTGIVRVDVGPTRERQTLTQQLDRGRRDDGSAKMPEALLRAMYATGGVYNPFAAILRVADSISLSGPQADSITVLNRVYTRRSEAIWTPIAKELAALPNDYDADAAYRRYVGGRRETIDLLADLAPHARALLTGDQLRRLPTYLVAHLDTRFLTTVRSGTAGLGLAYLPGVSAPRTTAIAAGGTIGR